MVSKKSDAEVITGGGLVTWRETMKIPFGAKYVLFEADELNCPLKVMVTGLAASHVNSRITGKNFIMILPDDVARTRFHEGVDPKRQLRVWGRSARNTPHVQVGLTINSSFHELFPLPHGQALERRS